MAAVLVPLANGVEEMEAVIIIDILRRAGWDVTSAAVESSSFHADKTAVLASRGVVLLADTTWDMVDPAGFDVLALPGGSDGTDALAAHPGVLAAVRAFVASGKLVGAVCAAPLVLKAAGVLAGRTVTCHPAVRDQMAPFSAVGDRVVVDGRIVTSQGPGTAMEFALALLQAVDGKDAAENVASGLVLQA